MKLVLFDIDGILVRSGQTKYLKKVGLRHYGIDLSKFKVYNEGKTDRQWLIETLKNAGFKNPEKDKRFNKALDSFGSVVEEYLKGKKIKKVPFVEGFIKAVIKEKHVTGLLTGNTFGKAKVKLEKANLWHYFKIGAFGHETSVRSKLVPIALNDTEEKTGIKFEKKNVFLVGDTVRDIQCAKQAGVKSIAVASGKESIEQLRKEKPDFIFKNFSNTKAILNCLK